MSHTFIRREIRALEREGFEVARFSLRDTRGLFSETADEEEAAKTKVLLDRTPRGVLALAAAVGKQTLRRPLRTLKALGVALKHGARSNRLAVHLAYLAEAALLVQCTKTAGVSHVHAHFGTNSATVAMLAHALGGPSYSFTVHGPEEFDRSDTLQLGDKIARARFVVGVSSFGKSQLLRHTPSASWDKVKVVACGVDASFLDETWLRPIPTAPRLVCIGRLCEQKGQLLLLEAAGQLHAEGLAFELVIVGDGEMRPQVEASIALHRLEGVVRLLGWASGDRVREEMNAARALVLPSFAEGLPVVIMESLALRRPVISTFVAGIPELVETGACGWLVPAGDVPSLKSAMRAALTASGDELLRLGTEGRRRVLERHDATLSAQHLATSFRALESSSPLVSTR